MMVSEEKKNHLTTIFFKLNYDFLKWGNRNDRIFKFNRKDVFYTIQTKFCIVFKFFTILLKFLFIVTVKNHKNKFYEYNNFFKSNIIKYNP